MSVFSMCEYADCERSVSCLRFLDVRNSDYQPTNKFWNICYPSDNPEKNYKWYIEVKTDLVQKEGENND